MNKLKQLIQLEQNYLSQKATLREEMSSAEVDLQKKYQAKFDELQALLDSKEQIIAKEVEKRCKKITPDTQYHGLSLHPDAKSRLLTELNK
jgi:hypothetical protein